MESYKRIPELSEEAYKRRLEWEDDFIEYVNEVREVVWKVKVQNAKDVIIENRKICLFRSIYKMLKLASAVIGTELSEFTNDECDESKAFFIKLYKMCNDTFSSIFTANEQTQEIADSYSVKIMFCEGFWDLYRSFEIMD